MSVAYELAKPRAVVVDTRRHANTIMFVSATTLCCAGAEAAMSQPEHHTESLHGERRRGGVVIALRDLTTSTLYALDGERGRWSIGTGDGCDIAIADPYVSARHCLIERRVTGTLVVRDIKSRNGTFIDGNPIEVADLCVGAQLRIGRTTLVAISSRGGHHASAIEQLRGNDPGLRRTIDQALRAAQSECNVLVVGETGTGKDLLARLIHESSKRAGHAFVAVNCGAIPRELIGSELFGHDRGAFTGASDDRDGYFAQAHEGTLFLDELAELPIELQPHLLRAIETKRVRRLGSDSERAIDVRIVAATNRMDGLGTESGRLRLDLYHRIATVQLALPPLRERMGDLPVLVEAMLDELAPEYGTKHIAADGWEALSTYGWPGNVRELRHAVARAVALGGDELGSRDFFPEYSGGRRRIAAGTPSPDEPTTLKPYESVLRGAMELALKNHGTIRAAASSLGMPKSTFADRARAWGLPTHRKKWPTLGNK
jgi:DNA-binding NtrC family response regulator